MILPIVYTNISICSLNTLFREGRLRLAFEVLVVFGAVTVVYTLALEPILHLVAPGMYARSGLDYSRTDLLNTASETTQLSLVVVVGASHLFWRLNYTQLGVRFRDAVMEDYYEEDYKTQLHACLYGLAESDHNDIEEIEQYNGTSGAKTAYNNINEFAAWMTLKTLEVRSWHFGFAVLFVTFRVRCPVVQCAANG